MRFLDKEDAEKLASDWGYQIDQEILFQNDLDVFTFPFPTHREGMSFLAREIVTLLGRFDHCLLLITEYGIWPSMEDLNLFNRFRQSCGFNESFPKCLGQVFDVKDADDIASCLHLMIIFGWGGFVFLDAPEEDKIALFVSHDSWGRLVSGSRKIGKVEVFVDAWIRISEEHQHTR